VSRDVLERELATARKLMADPRLATNAAITVLAVQVELDKLDGPNPERTLEMRELASRLVAAGRMLPRALGHLANGAIARDWNTRSELIEHLEAMHGSDGLALQGLRIIEDAVAHRDHVEVRRHHLRFLYRLSRYDELLALACAHEADETTSCLVAWSLILTNRAAEAEPHAWLAIGHQRTNPRAYLALAEALWAKGDQKTAIGTLAQMVSVCEGGPLAEAARRDASRFMSEK
jgi:hypothetical protein